MNDIDENEVSRLPLWKNCLDRMIERGLSYGQTWDAEFFEKELKANRKEMQFGLAISEIRRELEKDGYYLSGRGQKGDQFVILPPETNAQVMQGYQRQALDALKRGVILGTNTRLDTLTDQERKRHESTLEKIATRCALMMRSKQVAAIVRDKKPDLLHINPK